ncbi:hypothetical protein [Pontimicrobium sp. IMCC45349]|uniref:hypothetical protein n=1 Tax=Pontimicrobium sp. IMCC45349 TaxID=3391574 RepID=UPI0039A2DC5C
MKARFVFALCVLLTGNLLAQDKTLPFYEIPEAPSVYNECTVVARMIEGLGFRYYWATEGLRAEDLAYKASESGRTSDETIDHIYGLSKVIVNSALKVPNERGEEETLSFEEKRKKTLENFKTAADIFRVSKSLEEFTIVFKRGGNTSEFPFWNQINGPIEDAVWHCGQVVMLRRASGNPFSSNVSVFSGKVKE